MQLSHVIAPKDRVSDSGDFRPDIQELACWYYNRRGGYLSQHKSRHKFSKLIDLKASTRHVDTFTLRQQQRNVMTVHW